MGFTEPTPQEIASQIITKFKTKDKCIKWCDEIIRIMNKYKQVEKVEARYKEAKDIIQKNEF